ncbi:MAG: hypothetical protein ACLSVD_06275 [Eggerthellaceae bacterium]
MGIVVLAAGILTPGGGYEAIMGSIAQNHPEMLELTSGGNMPPSLYLPSGYSWACSRSSCRSRWCARWGTRT